jgi:hypothetical protein
LSVKGTDAVAGVAPSESSLFSDYRTVWVGSFLDPAPAQKAAETFRRKGLASFTVQKTLMDKRLLRDQLIGDYHLVMVGLFGDYEDAENLGKLLQAQGQIVNWQVVPSDNPGEIGQAAAQTEPLQRRSEVVAAAAADKAGQPMSPSAPAVTGDAFKGMVRGRFIGSFRDYQEAKKEAERLSASGWPASVVSDSQGGGMWHRVVLAEPSDRRDFQAPPAELAAARASAASQEGLILLVDTSGVKGVWGAKEPVRDRRDASACAGYSQAGRLYTCLERLVGYVPESGMLASLKNVAYRTPDGIADRLTRPVRNWWSGDDSSLTESPPAYGVSIFNRTGMMSSIRNLRISENSAPIGPALDNLFEAASIPGRKTVILFSEFGRVSSAPETLAALGRLKRVHGDSLRLFVVYGDTDDQGWKLAENMAKAAGAKEAWNGCQLLADNSYFERFVKTVFSR